MWLPRQAVRPSCTMEIRWCFPRQPRRPSQGLSLIHILIEDTKAKLSLDDLFSQIQAGNVKELPIIVKADVQGSVEAVKQSLTKLSNEEVMVKVIHGGVGAINESDVSLASASNAIIIGFNIRPDATAKSIAEREKVDIRLYKVIDVYKRQA